MSLEGLGLSVSMSAHPASREFLAIPTQESVGIQCFVLQRVAVSPVKKVSLFNILREGEVGNLALGRTCFCPISFLYSHIVAVCSAIRHKGFMEEGEEELP